MKTGIIAIGSELLRGDIIDTNSPYLCHALDAAGIEVISIDTVADDERAIRSSIKRALNMDIVFVVGGLGPTEDDITREASASALGLKLKSDKRAKMMIEQFFRAIGRAPTDANLSQAMLPETASIISNERGTAPGFSLIKERTAFYFLPGVPYEMKTMFDKHILPQIKEKFPNLKPYTRNVFKLFGVPEAKVGDTCRKIARPPGVLIGFYPRFPEVHISLSYREENSEILNYIDKISNEFSEFIFSDDGGSLEEKLVDALIKNQLTLSVAESCTGGLISAQIVGVAGSSACFDRAIVSYSNASKMDELDVPRQIIEEKGAVSKECAMAMARGVREITGSSIGISATGISGPTGGLPGKPVGTTFVAISTKRKEEAWRFEFKRDRNQNRSLTVYAILTKLLKEIRGGNF